MTINPSTGNTMTINPYTVKTENVMQPNSNSKIVMSSTGNTEIIKLSNGNGNTERVMTSSGDTETVTVFNGNTDCIVSLTDNIKTIKPSDSNTDNMLSLATISVDSVACMQSDKIALPASNTSSGIRCMFLCRVLVGQFTVGRRTYRKPPPIDPVAPFSKSFDSCVNYLDEPTLFVLFDSSQCYPEYLIYYTQQTE